MAIAPCLLALFAQYNPVIDKQQCDEECAGQYANTGKRCRASIMQHAPNNPPGYAIPHNLVGA